MERIKRLGWISFVCALIFILACTTAFAAENSSGLTYTWDLKQMYASQEDWEADYAYVEKTILPKIENYRGKLGDANALKEYLDLYWEANGLLTKLYLYGYLGTQKDQTNATSRGLVDRLYTLDTKVSVASAFADSELVALPQEVKSRLLGQPVLSDYAFMLKDILADDADTLGEEARAVLSGLFPTLGMPETVFSTLTSVEIQFEPIQTSKGETIVVDEGNYGSLLESPDRGIRKAAQESMMQGYQAHNYTLASLLAAHVKNQVALARVQGYDHVLDMALENTDVPVNVYHTLIHTTNQNLAPLHRYITLRKEALGLDTFYGYDMYVPLSNYHPQDIAYATAAQEVQEALQVLGSDYRTKLSHMLTSGHIDVYPAANKVSGGFSVGGLATPYILLNHNGTFDSVSTLSHELGHALYSMYAYENQPVQYQQPTIFTHEVASTTNEALLSGYVQNRANTTAEKLFYLDQQLSNFVKTYYSQVMYAEFEEFIYQTVEQGGSLSADLLNEKWLALQKKYFGEDYKVTELTPYGWSRIPHFYYTFYVYQYATSIACATDIGQRILQGQEGALEQYRSFLKAGASKDPVSLLQLANVDPTNASTMEAAIGHFDQLLDEFETLVKDKSTR